MAMELAEYAITGDYIYHRKNGSQNGRIIHYSDGKLIGTVEDCDQEGSSAVKKFFLGIAYNHNRNISFVKISQFSEHLLPVAWTMEAQIAPTDGIAKDYSGCWLFAYPESWLFAHDSPAIKGLEASLGTGDPIEIVRCLKKISVNELRQTYFRQKFLTLVSRGGVRYCQTGSLSFSRIRKTMR